VLTCLRISLLCIDGSDGPAKQAEKQCYEDWLQSKRDKLDKNHKLYYAPFNNEEWESKGYDMPKKPSDKGMAMLGQGGDMTAYRMKNDVGELFAVKIVKLDRMTKEEVKRTRKHVEREARTLERLTHRYVIRYHGMYEDEDEEGVGLVGVVMELAQGGSLSELIKAREERGEYVGMAELLNMSMQMAEALDYVHGEGILHRDVKAANVLLANTEGEPVCIKLADFGVAAVLTQNAGTKRYTKVGTDEYLSPEQAMSRAYGSKADMWGLGCILVELASCRRLQGSLWADTVEVNDRRNKYLIQVHERAPVLGDIAKSLLDRDATSRLSALELRMCLDKLKKRLEQEAEDARVARALQAEEEERMSAAAARTMQEAEEEERMSVAAARALQEAEDARVARALQAEEEERMSAAAAEKQRQEEEKAAKAAAAAEGARRVILKQRMRCCSCVVL
jgi:serine/threonine protein kinase